jgi:hypothetical protein
VSTSIVLLVHEGASDTSGATATSNATPFGQIVNGVNANVDAIVSGHTHLAYNHSVPVAAWADRPVTERPVVSAGQYGSNLNQLVFTVDVASGDVTAATQELLPLKTGQTANYPADGATARIVSDAVAAATPIGNQPLGEIEAPFSRAKFANGSTENRGGESTLSNLVAEVQRWATEAPGSGGAQIAFMNPGGLRADLVGTLNGTQRELTYRQAADVQPFANTLVNMDLTGADIKEVLEQQWQRDAGGAVPSRPFLKLGTSEGFAYTYDPTAAEGSRITSMTLHGEPVVATSTYSVTVNSFLASGGDNFRAFTNGTGTRDTGKVDLQAMVDYFEQVVGTDPLVPDYSQRAVGVAFPGDDNSVTAGEAASFNLTSLILTGVAGGVSDLKDSEITVSLGETVLGTFPVDQTIPNPGTGSGEADGASTDESGKATVTVDIPESTPAGVQNLTVAGATTGTEIQVPITVEAGPAAATVIGTAEPVEAGQDAVVSVVVDATDSDAVPTGTVNLLDGTTQVGTVELEDGQGDITVPASLLEIGDNTFTLAYEGDEGFDPSTGSVTVTVTKAAAVVTGTPTTFTYGQAGTVPVAVSTANDVTPTGTVTLKNGATTLGSTTLGGDGTGTIAIAALTLPAGTYTLTLEYSGDANVAAGTGSVSVTVEQAASTTEAAANPTRVTVKRNGTVFRVQVTAPAHTPTGSVEVRVNTSTVVRATLDDEGVAVLRVASWPAVGTFDIAVRYLGDVNTLPSGDTVRVTVVKQTPSLTLKVPGTVKKGARPTVTATLGGTGGVVTGQVRFVYNGKRVTLTLSRGKATLKLAKITRRTNLTVTYLGTGTYNSVSKSRVIKVKR